MATLLALVRVNDHGARIGVIGRPRGAYPCFSQPCPHRGRAGSGLCALHYKKLWKRTLVFRRACGTGLTFAAAHEALGRVTATDPVAQASLDAVRALFAVLHDGTVILQRAGARRDITAAARFGTAR